MTHFKVGFLTEEWRKSGPFANPIERDGPKVYHIRAHGRKDWPEPVLVAIVFSDAEADLIIADHEAGQQISLVSDIREQAISKILLPKGASLVLPY